MVTPLTKMTSISMEDLKNYRQVLSFLPQLVERAVSAQIRSHMDSNDLSKRKFNVLMFISQHNLCKLGRLTRKIKTNTKKIFLKQNHHIGLQKGYFFTVSKRKKNTIG